MYCGYGIALDRKGRWNFGNYNVKNVLNFGIDSSSSHVENRKNNLPTCGTNGIFASPAKKFSINFNKAEIKFCLIFSF